MVQSYSNVVSVEVKSLDVLRQHGGNMSWLDVCALAVCGGAGIVLVVCGLLLIGMR